jgi:hypothetical protein
MRKILYICLSLLCCCQKPEIKSGKNCVMLKISKALPVEFWLDGVQTFNEKDENYIDKFCFNQKFKCATDIRLRVTDSEIKTYFLQGFDRDSNQVLNLPFTRSQVNNSLIDEKFTTDLDGWAGGGYGISHKSETWSWVGGLAVSDVSQVGATIKHTQVLSEPFALAAGKHFINIYYELGDSSTDQQTITLQLFLINAGAVVRTINIDQFAGQTSSYQKQITNFPFVADIAYDAIGFGFIYSANSLTIDTRIGRIEVGDLLGNYYDVNFVGSDYSLCDTQLQLFIKEQYGIGELTQFNISLGSEPINFQTAPVNMSLGALAGGHDLAVFESSAIDILPGTYNFTFDLNSTQEHGTIRLEFFRQGTSVGFASGGWDLVSGDISVAIPITISQKPDKVTVEVRNTTFGLSTIIKLFDITTDAPTADVAKSDFIEITSIVGQLETLKYRSSQSFAGLYWNGEEEYMQLDVDSRFFHSRPKDTLKAIDLNNHRVIGTASELKKQKVLEVYAAPEYFHTKLELALMHSVKGDADINGVAITMEEGYTQTDLGSFNPFSTAEVWLTEREFFEKATI